MTSVKESVMKCIFALCALMSIGAVVAICVFIFANGIPAIGEIGVWQFLSGRVWKPSVNIYGIFPMIIASLYVTAGAIIVGVAPGVLTAVFLLKYCPARLRKPMHTAINLLAGIPSIVYGFFALMVIVPLIGEVFYTGGKGILTASLLLGIMILPTIINTAYSSLKAVPDMYFEGSLALGATRERSIFFAMFPAASSGVLSGIILGVGRAIGETMAVVMVAGNQAVMPGSVLSGARTLTANIVLEMSYAAGLHRGALVGTAVVLFVFILIINLCFSAIKQKKA